MGGMFGIASKDHCVRDLFFGTDYHSHLGTVRGGMAVYGAEGISRYIHDISNTPFRSKFEDDLCRMPGNVGIGVISDYDDQPLLINSHLGIYAIATVGKINNASDLSMRALSNLSHFSEMTGGEVNPTEVVASLINREASFADGIRSALELVDGSCSILVMTADGIYAARDRLGRTPLATGSRDGAFAVASETCALPNLGFENPSFLGPGEVVFVSAEGIEKIAPPGLEMKICSFLWIYYGFPASSYEDINVEVARNRCGAALARRDSGLAIDMAAGIPDSGTSHAVGYASQAGVPYRRPFVKYTPTWPRSFMPQDQSIRDLVARMKLIPIRDMMHGRKILFCEDSIVRGTQLRGTIRNVFACGASEVHMRPACPPLIYSCKYLNFSRSKSEMDLAARMAIREIEGETPVDLKPYSDPDSPEHAAMVERIRLRLGLTTLKYQRLDDMIEAIGLPREKLCAFCWNGKE